jgi:tetratricopeptide (TPR) repeat protein
MNCPNCNEDIPEGKKFCGHCGQRLTIVEPEDIAAEPASKVEVVPAAENPVAESQPDNAAPSLPCPVCGVQNPAGARFCNACATELEIASPKKTAVQAQKEEVLPDPIPEVVEPAPKTVVSQVKRGLPKWVWGIGAVFVMGLVIIGILVGRRTASSDDPLVEVRVVEITATPQPDPEPTPTAVEPAKAEEDDEPSQPESQELPPVPAFVSDVLQGATYSVIEDFDTLSDDWLLSTRSIQRDVVNQRIQIPSGISDDGAHLGAPYEITAGQAILVRFQFDKDGELRTFLEAGTWETASYRRWGMFSTVGYFREDTYLGVDWRGQPILEGNVLSQPDTWYYLLLVVGTEGRFGMWIWEYDDPSQYAEYWELDESQWENKTWSFLLSNWGGEILLDSLAVIDFSAMRDLSPAEIHFWTGKDYNREGDYESALSEYDQAIQLDDQVPYFFRKRGVMHWILGNQGEILEDFRSAIELDPDNYWTLRNLSIYYQQENDFDQAYYYADRVIQVAPELPDGYGLMASAEMDINDDPASAIIDYSQAIERYRRDAELFRERCIAYNTVEKYSAAVDDCTQCLELNPEHDGCYFDRGWAYDGMGNTKAAVNDLEAYLDLVGQDVCPECQERAKDYIAEHK